jgi:hypothetical protein
MADGGEELDRYLNCVYFPRLPLRPSRDDVPVDNAARNDDVIAGGKRPETEKTVARVLKIQTDSISANICCVRETGSHY